MKVAVVYDTVSPMKLTGKVAETIVGVLKDRGLEVDSFYVKDVDKNRIQEYDCLIAGAPTMAFRPSAGMKQFLDSLSEKDFSGKSAAAFDTQVQMIISGNAAKGIDGKLKKLGFKSIREPLVVYVEGKSNEMRFKEGELEKAKKWATELVETVAK
jgi:flavodoxin